MMSTSTSRVGNAEVQGGGPEPLSRWVMRWVTRASVMACVLSLVIHVVLGMIGYAVHVRLGGGGGGGPGGPVEVATISQTDLQAIEASEMASLAPGVDDRQTVDVETHVQIELPGGSGMTDVGDLGDIGDGFGGAGTGTGIGIGTGAGGAGVGTAKFFDVVSRGERFAYIVDNSGSMGGEKIAALKKELASSIDALPETAQFVVIAFNTTSEIVGKRERWIEASAKNKSEVIKDIMNIEAFGGTEPMPAFGLVFGKFRPRPDSVYFLTDGQFNPEDADRIIMMCRTAGRVPVQAITFVSRDGEALLKKIGRDTGGSYTHVAGPVPAR
jgi:hypothetical protein